MVAAARYESQADPDQRVYFRGLTWKELELILAIRGDAAVPRIHFLEGALELMNPSSSHEELKERIGRLVECFAEVTGLILESFGSWTLKDAPTERGAEPDKSYIVGPDKDRPDLAIEVDWTSGGLDKLAIYLGLAVREVWFWRKGRIEVHVLQGGAYALAAQSAVLPGLDLDLLSAHLDHLSQTEAVRAFRSAIRGQ